MKNEIKVLVVCSNEEYQFLKSSFASISTEIIIKYNATSYNEGLSIINDKNNDIDAILIDSELEKCKVLQMLEGYNEQSMLSLTIVMDNIKLDCYNLEFSSNQLYNVIPKNYKMEELLYYL